MEHHYGKAVPTTLAELVAPGSTALLLVDLQHDFVDPEGVFGLLGADTSTYPAVLTAVASLLRAARTAGIPVIHLRNTALPNGASDSPAQIRFNLRMHAALRKHNRPLQYTLPGTWGAEFAAQARPIRGETIVPKYRSSGFTHTPLDTLLRSQGTTCLVIAGCTTEGCVESTARDALAHDYHVVIPADCVGSDDPRQHQASLLLMRHRVDVVDSGERIARCWAAARPADPPQDGERDAAP
jgi:nicotinamidase-related amidase